MTLALVPHRLRAAVASLRLLQLFVLLLQPTVEASVVLLRRQPAAGPDVFAGVVGLVASCCPVVGCVAVVGPLFAASPEPRQHARRSASAAASRVSRAWMPSVRWARALLDRLLEPSLEYRDGGTHFVAMYGALFEDYRRGRHWYVAAELLSEVAQGVIRGLVPVYAGQAAPPSCGALRIAMLAVVSATVLAMLAARPHGVVLDAALSWASVLMLLLCCALLLAYGSGAVADAASAAVFWVAVVNVAVPLPLWLISLRPLRALRHVIAFLRNGTTPRRSSAPSWSATSRTTLDDCILRVRTLDVRERALAVLVGLACRGASRNGEAAPPTSENRLDH